jgi:YD repeat-containing protein
VYADACRVTESRVLGKAAVEIFELFDDEQGRPEVQTRSFNDRETGRTTYTHDAEGHLTQIEATAYDLTTTTRFTWDAAGHVTGAKVTDPFDAVSTFTYTWEGDRLVSMEAEERFSGVDEPSRWGTRYAYADDGRLATKRLLRSNSTTLTVEYDYDDAGHLVVKRFQSTGDHTLPVEDAYTWKNDRLRTIERAEKGRVTRYAYDDHANLVGVESVVLDGEVERVESTIDFAFDCYADVGGLE